jgi:hypothetical protein
MRPPAPLNVPSLPLQSQELLARARQYRTVAMQLRDFENGRPNCPKYTLLFHAIELALKAAIVSYGIEIIIGAPIEVRLSPVFANKMPQPRFK